jgi:hypothetical protein
MSSHSSPPLIGHLEVRLDVPNLGHAVSFYSRVFDTHPTVVERRLAWFEVPESTLCIELREALTPVQARLRLCTDQSRLQRIASRSGVTVAQARLTLAGSPRAISFMDPGHNHWELYTPIVASSPPPGTHRSIRRSLRLLTRRARAAWTASAAVEARFHERQAHDQALLRRYG